MEKMDNEEFKRRVRCVNGDRYDLTNTEFKDPKMNVTVTCEGCGKEISIEPVKLLAGIGCKKCYVNKNLDRDSFISRSKAIYGENAFDYSLTDYVQYHTPVKIKCNTCGKIFKRKPSTHLTDHACPYCSASLGVRKIWDFLDSYSIDFEREKAFPGLVYNRNLRYDFYIPNKDIIIEYHGELHYNVGYGEPEAKLQEKLKKDAIKKQYAEDNGLTYFVIPYTELVRWEKVEENLKKLLHLPLVPPKHKACLHSSEHVNSVLDNGLVSSPMDVIPHFEDESELKRVAMNCASYLWVQLGSYDKDKRDFIISKINALLSQL